MERNSTNQYTKEDYIRALQLTLEKYDRKQVEHAITLLTTQNSAEGFTRDGRARYIIESDIEKSKEVLLSLWHEYDFNETSGISKNYTITKNIGSVIEYGTASENILKKIARLVSEKLPKKRLLPNGTVSSVKLNPKAIKQVEVMAKLSGCDGFNYEYTNSKNIGNMQIASNKGISRENQEDAGLIMQHPNLSNFKILLVADGMGGHLNGEIASDYLVSKLEEWFQTVLRIYIMKIIIQYLNSL